MEAQVSETWIQRTILLAALLLVVGHASGPAEAGEDEIRTQHAAIAGTVATGLEKLWGQAKELTFGREADLIAAQLIHFSSDHAEARAWLGHVREAGAWKAPRPPVRHENESAKDIDAFRGEWTGHNRDRAKSLWTLFEKAKGDLHQETRDFLLTDIYQLTPSDERTRKLMTVFYEDGFWLTTDVLRFREGNQRLLDFRHGVPPRLPEAKPISVTPANKKLLTMKWKHAVQFGDLPVWSMADEKETRDIGHAVLWGAEVFAHLFQRKRAMPADGYGIVILPTHEDRIAFLEHLGIEADHRAGMGSFPVPGDHSIHVTARWQGPNVRMDSAVTQLIIKLFIENFGRAPEGDWSNQAARVAVTFLSCWTRLSLTGGRPEDHDELERYLTHVLFDQAHGWLPVARDVANAGKLPTLEQLAPQSAREIWVRDLLSCYTYGNYLILAHGDKATDIFQRLGDGETTKQVLTDVLGIKTLAGIDKRVRRWVNDQAAFEEGKSRRQKATRPLPR